MSHRALVAIETEPDVFNLHYSHNGAQDLNLTDLLEDYVAGTPGSVDTVANRRTKQLPQFQKWRRHNTLNQQQLGHNANRPAVEPDPMYTDVPLDEVAYFVSFDAMEAVYLVRDGAVETYVPVWTEPNVIRPWRDHLSVEVYHMDTLPDDPRKHYNKLQSADPVRVIDEERLTGTAWRDDRIVSDVVRSTHENVHALHRRCRSGAAPKNANSGTTPSTSDPVMNLLLESYHLQFESDVDGELTPSPTGRGLLVRIPNNDVRQQRRIAATANQARFEAGARLNTLATIDAGAKKQARTTLAKPLFTKFGDRIAPLSPPPYRSLVKRAGLGQEDDD